MTLLPSFVQDTTEQTPDLLQVYMDGLTFQLDDFQYEAVSHIHEGHSVVVCAPTGSGKTTIAEFAALKALAEGKKLFYTTPLKALSNQKYHDLKQRYGEHNVGVLTGDTSQNREARVVVMTTEVFRNMLYGLNEDASLLNDLGYVVLDECHFMNDADRGTVWEESIIYCPAHVQMIALSATVANAEELTRWMNKIHPVTKLVWSDFRPVPLRFYYHREKEILPLFERGSRKLNGRLKFERSSRDPKVRNQPFNPMYCLQELHERNMLPAIFFTFSRKGCDKGMFDCRDLALNTEVEQAEIKRIMDEFIEQTSLEMDTERYQCFINGVASHHAGLLPGVKLLVEQLFQKNLLKVVFATETLAAGINMPARTTVITAISKRTNEGHRMLTASEFLQMSGRAGRRGLDDQGHVVVVKTPFNDAKQAARIASSPPDALNSQFTPTYGMVLNLMQTHTLDEVSHILGRSFGSFTTARRTKPFEQEMADVRGLIEQANHYDCPAGLTANDLQEHMVLRRQYPELTDQLGIINKQLKTYGATEELTAEKQRLQEAIDVLNKPLRQSPCFSCRDYKHHRRLVERIPQYEAHLEHLRLEMEGEVNVYQDTFRNLFHLLQELGYLGGDGKPTEWGVVTADIRTENEIFVAEILREGLLDNLEPSELAGIVSVIVNDSGRENVTSFVAPSRAVKQTVNKLFRLAESVQKAQKRYQVQVPISINPAASPLVEAWARGTDWTSLRGMTNMDQGDLVRNLRRVCDLLRQFSRNPHMPKELSRIASEAFEAIHRDPVKEVEVAE